MNIKPPCWIPDLPNADYHAGPGLSKSGMIYFDKSPAHYQWNREHPEPPTPAMVLGSAFHIHTLEIDRFYREYVVQPEDMKLTTKAGKAWQAEQEEAGKTIVKFADYETIKGMSAAVWASPTCQWLLEGADIEVPGFWLDPITGTLCKLRADAICKKETPWIFIDLKSCVDARKHKFLKIAYDKKYHWQAAHYLYGASQIEGVEHRQFIFIAVEKTPPYGLCVYQADSEMLLDGQIETQQVITEYAKCEESGLWPCYSDEIQEISLPGWAKRKTNPMYDN